MIEEWKSRSENNRITPPAFGGNNRLMFITHRTPKYTECDEVSMAIQGGCSWIQSRMKDGIHEDTVRTCATI